MIINKPEHCTHISIRFPKLPSQRYNPNLTEPVFHIPELKVRQATDIIIVEVTAYRLMVGERFAIHKKDLVKYPTKLSYSINRNAITIYEVPVSVFEPYIGGKEVLEEVEEIF